MSFNRFERPLLEGITVEKTEMEDDIRIRCYEILTNDHRDLQPTLGAYTSTLSSRKCTVIFTIPKFCWNFALTEFFTLELCTIS